MQRHLVGAALMMSLASCAQPAGLADGAQHEVTEDVGFDLIAVLSERAALFEKLGFVASPPFEVEAQLLRVDGHLVWAFEYADTEVASREASRFSEDGTQYRRTNQATMITWVGPPHLFIRERWIAVFAGSDDAILALLSDLMGQQFAGAES